MPISNNLKFLLFKRVDLSAQDTALLAKADVIIKQCRTNLSLSVDKQAKKTLDEMIVLVSQIIEELKRKNSSAQIIDLQKLALRLPARTAEQGNLASSSYATAVACLFIAALTLSFTLGFAFHAWYFAYLTPEVLFDYLASVVATIGIPAVVLGTFAYGVHLSQDVSSQDIEKLQDNINDFCESLTREEDVVSLNHEDTQLV